MLRHKRHFASLKSSTAFALLLATAFLPEIALRSFPCHFLVTPFTGIEFVTRMTILAMETMGCKILSQGIVVFYLLQLEPSLKLQPPYNTFFCLVSWQTRVLHQDHRSGAAGHGQPAGPNLSRFPPCIHA